MITERHSARKLPDDFALVQSVFSDLHSWEKNEPHSADFMARLPSDLSVVFGVLCMASDSAVRAVIRNTWMNNAGVCALLSPASPECRVHAGFFLGTGKGEAKDDAHQDILVLNMPENMNEGKTYQYLHEASRKFDWATHFVKLDTDTYPFLHVLLPRISAAAGPAREKGCDIYLGQLCNEIGLRRAMEGKPKNVLPPPACGLPIYGDLLRYEVPGGNAWDPEHNRTTYRKCFTYMRGGLYVISRRIALEATEDGGVWALNKEGAEDAVTGYNLVNYARNHDRCLHTWDPPTPQETGLQHFAEGSQRGWLHLRADVDWHLVDRELPS
eukprot:TRINITY_DN14018_c0_g1_i1.p1 TRINITY_DN14018_c0_g1~~TRINITY_DN14018_c0_g1_i1.p1  ORF type:complete len:327 (+),score=0.97 TRINITY_DN14018_c0_g1_i1:334-1314(+)